MHYLPPPLAPSFPLPLAMDAWTMIHLHIRTHTLNRYINIMYHTGVLLYVLCSSFRTVDNVQRRKWAYVGVMYCRVYPHVSTFGDFLQNWSWMFLMSWNPQGYIVFTWRHTVQLSPGDSPVVQLCPHEGERETHPAIYYKKLHYVHVRTSTWISALHVV